MRRLIKPAWLIVAIIVVTWGTSSGAHAQRDPKPRTASAADLHWWPIRDGIWMLVGAGVNITASVGPDGVLLVNAGNANAAERVLAAVKDLQSRVSSLGLLDASARTASGVTQTSRSPFNTHAPPKPVRYVVNTSALPSDAGADEYLVAKTGATVLTHENVLTRLVEGHANFAALPTQTYADEQYKLGTFFNGEGVRLLHVPNAATDGDSIVYFRGADVIAAGNLLDMNGFPIIDVDKGGSIDGVIDGLNEILNLAIPASAGQGGTTIVPGRGRLADFTDVRAYRDMLAVIRDQVQSLVDKGMTREQVVDSHPAFGYEARYGAKSGPWTTKMFIDAVYRSLKKG